MVATAIFKDISDVPADVVDTTVVELLSQFGATADEELRVGVARRLGLPTTSPLAAVNGCRAAAARRTAARAAASRSTTVSQSLVT